MTSTWKINTSISTNNSKLQRIIRGAHGRPAFDLQKFRGSKLFKVTMID